MLCHKPDKRGGHAIEVSENALPAHMAHGDTEGACESIGTTTASTTTAAAPTTLAPAPAPKAKVKKKKPKSSQSSNARGNGHKGQGNGNRSGHSGHKKGGGTK